MNTIDPAVLDGILAAGLRERASDRGDERSFVSQVVAAATALPQRRSLLSWPDSVTRRTGLILVAGVIGAGMIAAAISGGQPSPPPTAAPPVRNGPLLIIDSRVSWWIDSATGKKLTGPDYPEMPDGIQDAAFSRDGRRLALVVDGVLELFDTATGVRTVLAPCAAIGWQCLLETERLFSIDWSPDARSIVVARATGLVIVEVETGAITQVTTPIGGDVHYSSPTWSPDGRWIAFEYWISGGGPYVEAIRPDGTDRYRVSAPTGDTDLGARIPSWSTDGSRIYYMTSDPFRDTGDFYTSGWSIYATAQAVGDGLVVGAPFQVADLVFVHCLGFCPTMLLAPDGSSVLLDSGMGMFVVPLDGTQRVELGNEGARPIAWRPVLIGN